MNTLCAHVHNVCTNGDSSSLATRMTQTPVSRGNLGESITRRNLLLIFVTVLLVALYVIHLHGTKNNSDFLC
jgi:hypothetical protein